MMYHAYQSLTDLCQPARALAKQTSRWLRPATESPIADYLPIKALNAACEVFTATALTHHRPDFGIDSVESWGKQQAITERVIHQTPFCSLLHFQKQGGEKQPKVLVVAPMSGHFATLLRGTVRTLLRDHDVYITDWHNIRDIPLREGKFDLEDFIQHTVDFINFLGPGTNIVAVCQPCVPALAAITILAQEHSPNQPDSMVLMAGPIDTRINPTSVNTLATSKPIEWFEKNVVSLVPLKFKGAMRRVYPGFLQISAFMSMNIQRHTGQFDALFNHLLTSRRQDAAVIQEFYEEYFAMMDLPAEFYLQTVKTVFQEFALARGEFVFKGSKLDTQAIRHTALLTVEGERDDICSLGQTMAAHELCGAIPRFKKRHHMQAGVGHYGVFNGRRWDTEVYPIARDFIYAHSQSARERQQAG